MTPVAASAQVDGPLASAGLEIKRAEVSPKHTSLAGRLTSIPELYHPSGRFVMAVALADL
jgi:hypothetical protein